MAMPRVVIVGRPNVGKSSLLNMIARDKVSIVDPTPGVTRDRVSIIADIDPPEQGMPVKPVEFIDTGGYGIYTAEGGRFDEIGNDLTRLTPQIEKQIAHAVSSADLILFCVDAQAGVTPQDEMIATMLREQRLGHRGRGKLGELAPIQVVATKVDGPRWESHAFELSALGFGEPLMCSSTSNYMRREMLDRLYAMLPDVSDEEDQRVASADLRIAIMGKRNAGKSSIVNALAGEDRVIVSEIPGTTRDAVDVRLDFDGRSIVAIDTAGLRRRRSFQDMIEHYAFDRARRALDRADVALLVIDATEKISQVDEQLAQLIVNHYKPCVIVVNKWDLAEDQLNRKGRPVTPDDYADYITKELKGVSWAPIVFVSAHERSNLNAMVDMAFEVHRQASHRENTGKINRLVRDLLTERGPTNKLGSQAKVYYVAQVATNPPTIALVVNKPELFTVGYQRFLLNRFRENLPFPEVPIRLIIRARKATDPAEHEPVASGGAASRKVWNPHDHPAEFLSHELPEGMTDEELLRAMPDDPEAYFEDDA
ncbi:MAG: ribosome biogenesis GTPase Der [Phycisphaeraceae bacterium]|nr:ribosome biogenesis GTPase Der [Phycisphaeraceae bacterium]MCW5754193.1 ribosome biogenesis GTPase Der [Phycisphaeraceae bacterium]